MTRSLGAEDKYHETISWFFMVLIAERYAIGGRDDWHAFIKANPDLLSKPAELLQHYYSGERLWSPLARRQFVLPDRGLISQ